MLLCNFVGCFGRLDSLSLGALVFQLTTLLRPGLDVPCSLVPVLRLVLASPFAGVLMETAYTLLALTM